MISEQHSTTGKQDINEVRVTYLKAAVPYDEKDVHNSSTIHGRVVEQFAHIGLEVLWVASVWQHAEYQGVYQCACVGKHYRDRAKRTNAVYELKLLMVAVTATERDAEQGSSVGQWREATKRLSQS